MSRTVDKTKDEEEENRKAEEEKERMWVFDVLEELQTEA